MSDVEFWLMLLSEPNSGMCGSLHWVSLLEQTHSISSFPR